MIHPLRPGEEKIFQELCGLEEVFGSRALTALSLYGLKHPVHRFYLSRDAKGRADAALHQNGQVLSIVTGGGPDLPELADFVRRLGVTEIDSTQAQDETLQKLLGGEMESSYFMEYPGTATLPLNQEKICWTTDPKAVYEVLCQSHEYYRDHLEYQPWAQDLVLRWQKEKAWTVLLWENQRPVGTGSILSTSQQAGAIAAVAVVPDCRGKGYGSAISAWLTNAILKQGKKPVLISGYDEVAALYRGLGYRETGRWGELYL